MRSLPVYITLLLFLVSCKKADKPKPTPESDFTYVSTSVDGVSNSSLLYPNASVNAVVKITFSSAINPSNVHVNVLFNQSNGIAIPFSAIVADEKTLIITSNQQLTGFKAYAIIISNLKSTAGTLLKNSVTLTIRTGLDRSDKFPRISDEALLDLVQRQTFNYFWDFGHSTSGLARERNTSGDVVTSGGSGFGVMTIVAGIHRNFITRSEGLARMQKIIAFLKTKAQRFHGAFPHWLDGNSGAAIPFSIKDNGADLVETSYLMQGLLTARQYFNGTDPAETALRNDINDLWNAVEWNWFRKGNENVLYWHWSPNYNWEMNHPIKGWNEALITYVLAASSPTYAITKAVYDNGWANNGTIKNGATYYGVQLPLGPANGGPLFFAHYSFLGINPKGLTDAYANYETQTKAHALIHYNYSKANPKNYFAYGDSCWGLTASDDINGYMAHEPNNDNGVLSPTAALSSFPYTPNESMQALKFFYYKLGDKLWKNYGFVDAFSLHDIWFADSFLAIDQGPIIIMIENYRSGLLWNLFMSCPEVKTGMRNLGFQSPQL